MKIDACLVVEQERMKQERAKMMSRELKGKRGRFNNVPSLVEFSNTKGMEWGRKSRRLYSTRVITTRLAKSLLDLLEV